MLLKVQKTIEVEKTNQVEEYIDTDKFTELELRQFILDNVPFLTIIRICKTDSDPIEKLTQMAINNYNIPITDFF
jgi:hypothetical protein